eukprot:scaffold630_cov399-Prasinococcus_capsulatus_cf.AAC.21
MRRASFQISPDGATDSLRQRVPFSASKWSTASQSFLTSSTRQLCDARAHTSRIVSSCAAFLSGSGLVLGSTGTLDLVRPGPHIVHNGHVEPWNDQVRAFAVDALPHACHLVEYNCTMTALHVHQGVADAIHGCTCQADRPELHAREHGERWESPCPLPPITWYAPSDHARDRPACTVRGWARATRHNVEAASVHPPHIWRARRIGPIPAHLVALRGAARRRQVDDDDDDAAPRMLPPDRRRRAAVLSFARGHVATRPTRIRRPRLI